MFDVSWGHASCGAAAFPNVAPGPVWGFKKHLSYEVSSFLRGTQWSWDPLRAACHFAAVPIAGPGQRGQSSALGGRFAGGEGSGRPRGGPPFPVLVSMGLLGIARALGSCRGPEPRQWDER